MDDIKILIVEDEEDQLELYEDAITEFNDESTKFTLVPKIAKTKENAEAILETDFFDAAFIDLNLTAATVGEETAEGNDLVDLIMQDMRYPIFVVTGKANGHITELAEKNTFIKLHIKDEEELSNNLLKEVEKIYSTGITKVLGARGSLNDYLDKIFWNHLSLTMPHWLSIECDNCKIEKTISRYTLTHLYEYMEETEGTEKILYDSSEMYIFPRIKTTIRPGDIVTNGELKYLVLTPACTIAKKCEQFQLIKIVLLADNKDIVKSKENIEKAKTNIIQHKKKKDSLGVDIYEDRLKKLVEVREKKINNLKGLIGNYISNTKGEGYHFLPKFLQFEESLVDFQDIITVSKDNINKYSGIATISIHFFKDIQARFSAFYARQGSPDFDNKKLSQGIMKKILES